MALAARCGLATLLTQHVQIAARGGAHATAKLLSLIGGMVAGADSISDMDLLRHGGMPRLFTDVRAPSTLGTFLVRHEGAGVADGGERRSISSPRSGGAKLEAA